MGFQKSNVFHHSLLIKKQVFLPLTAVFMLKNLCFSLFFFFVWSTSLYSQKIDSTWAYANYSKDEIYIPMRDGVKLFTTVYSPVDRSEFHPILMILLILILAFYYLFITAKISLIAGFTKSFIGFGYNPKNNRKPMITTNTIVSLRLTSAKTFVLVSPSIVC